MKKLLVLLGLVALAGTAAQADERDTMKRSAEILREFRSMPERQVPRAVLRDARGLAIIGGNVTLGGDVSAAAGPVGRDVRGAEGCSLHL